MEPTSEIQVGTVLAETYEITQLLGQGGMGAVYAAKHLRLPGKRVAIKVLLGLAATDREAYARFRREAEIASRIGHPNIVTVHDFNVLPSGTPYLVLEFLDGEDLAHRLERGALPIEQAMAIARQIGSALQAAHRADVVHRDLKPGNVYLVPTEIGGELVDQAKVLDFGISKIRGSSTVMTQDSVLLGTPQYMAPEQALGKNQQIDGRTDIFALGAIVYEMVSGKPAFMGNTLAEVVFKVVYDKQQPLSAILPTLPKNVSDAVEKALAKEQNDRFADVAEFIAALTGRPLQTLDRLRAKNPAPEAFAPTAPGLGHAATEAAAPATTGARGELSPLIPPTHVVDKPGAGNGLKIAFVAGVAVAAVAGVVLVKKLAVPKPPVTTPATVATVAPPPTGATVAPPPTGAAVAPTGVAVAPTGVAVAPTGAAVAPTGAPVAPTGVAVAPTGAPDKPGKIAAHAPTAKETLPPEVKGELDGAETQIDTNPQEAIRMARHTLQEVKSARAFSIVARAFCKQGDLGNAKAALHNVGSERARVIKYCKAAGTDLQ
jgi:serine/threonine-protein kinase